jgi:hypothetical protein
MPARRSLTPARGMRGGLFEWFRQAKCSRRQVRVRARRGDLASDRCRRFVSSHRRGQREAKGKSEASTKTTAFRSRLRAFAQRPALAGGNVRASVGSRGNGKRRLPGRLRTPGAWKPATSRDRQRNFSPRKALKTHKMRKESRFARARFEDLRTSPRRRGGAARILRRRGRSGAAREALTAKRSRSEMAPQRFEKIESGRGNGMGPEAPNLQDLVPGRAAHRAPRADPNGGQLGSYKVAENGA